MRLAFQSASNYRHPLCNLLACSGGNSLPMFQMFGTQRLVIFATLRGFSSDWQTPARQRKAQRSLPYYKSALPALVDTSGSYGGLQQV
jgi:hypothetical protein